MLAASVTAIVLLMSSHGDAQNCFSSLDCHGEEVEGISGTLTGCCAPGGGLSIQSRRQCTNCYTEANFESEGSSFFAGFFNNFDPRSSSRISKIRFSVDPISRRSTTFNIMALGQPQKTFSAPREVEFDARELNLRSPSERNKGVLISSKDGDPLSVIALAEEIQSSDAFKVLPCIKLPSDTYEYYAVSVPITQIPIDPEYADYEDYEEFKAIEGNSAIVVVTTEDNTTLQVTLTQTIRNVDLGDDLKDQIPKGEIEAGQTVTINLPRQVQTLYLPSENNLSGSHVVSDKPIVFTSGHECGTVPNNISYCDQMVEQIPPTATWGRRFITAPLAQRQSGDTFRIVASRDDTEIQISCTSNRISPVSLNRGGMSEVVISSDSSCYFESNQPVLLVQLSMSSNVDEVFEGDPFMVLVPPVEQYRNRYNIHSFKSSASRNNEIIGTYFVNILVPADTNPSGVLLNGSPVTNEVVDILCPDSERICAYSILVPNITDSPVLSHNASMRINAIVYWYAFRVAYGYFAGMTQRPIALPAVSLSASEYTVFENISSVTVTLVRSGDLESMAAVRFQTAQLPVDNAAIVGEDFVHVNRMVEFASGVTEVQMSIPVIDDVFPENPEIFEVFLSASPGVYIQSPAAASVLINDRDPNLPALNVSFVETSVTVREGVCQVRFTLEKTRGAVGPVRVRLFTSDNSAEAAFDYETIDEVVTFEIEDSRYQGLLLITDDDSLEEVEQLTLQIEPLSGPFPLRVVDDTTLVTITDNDIVVFGFERVSYITSESAEVLVLQVLLEQGSLNRTVRVEFSTFLGSATEGADYDPVTQILEFDEDVSTLSVFIPIMSDNLVEPVEVFFAQLATSQEDSENENIVIGRNIAQITIVDDDSATIGIVRERVTVREGEGNPRFSVMVMSGELGENVTLVYSTHNINATIGEDYVSVTNAPVTLSTSITMVEVVLEVKDDTEYEGELPESFGVQLSLMSGDNAQRVRIEQAVLEILIEDNEPRPVTRVGFVQSSYITVEEAGSAILLMTSDGINPDPVVISYSVVEENTQDGIDVMSTSGSFTLLPGAVLAAVTIPLAQDTTPESAERLTVTLTAGDDVSLTVDSATVTVLDTDIPDCGPLTPPANGGVDTSSGTTAGAVALYSCNQGRVLAGSAARVCGKDALWTPAPPTCEARRCGRLIDPANGRVTVSGTTEGSVATYTCDEGFTLSGSTTRTCSSDETWRPAAPFCTVTIPNCRPLTPPANGGIDTSSGSTAGSIALYFCGLGHVLTGSAARVCGNNRLWFPSSPPTCEAIDCGVLPDPVNGGVSTTVTTFGGVATYFCDTGFVLTGSTTRTCGSDGDWSGTAPTCPEIDCGILANPTNGQVSISRTTVGGVATYSCNQGYTLTGSSTRTCSSDRAWSGSAPTCDDNTLFSACYSAQGCSPSTQVRATSAADCCIEKDDGLYYSDGARCIQCNTFGWLSHTFEGPESALAYSVGAGYFKGTGNTLSANILFVRDSSASLQAGVTDFENALFNNRVVMRAGRQSSVSITLSVDNVAQEGTESGILRLVLNQAQPVGTFFRSDLKVVIEDTSITGIGFYRIEYFNYERQRTLPVRVRKTSAIANPVSVRVQPLTIEQALALNLAIPTVDVDITAINPRVPIRARAEPVGVRDFSPAAIDITFPADELATDRTQQITVNIPLFDDDIDEADREYFVLYLTLLDATSPADRLLDVVVSVGGIDDNDDIVIGFERMDYSFNEPAFGEVEAGQTIFLTKQGVTELTYIVLIQRSESTDGLEIDVDYTIDLHGHFGNQILFPANLQRLRLFPDQLSFTLIADGLAEGPETVVFSSAPEGTPTYQQPRTGDSVFQTATVTVIDEDR